MLFVDKKRTLRNSTASAPTSLVLHALALWFAALWWFGVFTAVGAIVFLLIALVIAIPLFRRWPYGRCRIEGDEVVLTPVRFLGLPLTRTQTIDLSEPATELVLTTRWVGIGPARRAPFILALKRPGRPALWLACSPSRRYLEREVRALEGFKPA